MKSFFLVQIHYFIGQILVNAPILIITNIHFLCSLAFHPEQYCSNYLCTYMSMNCIFHVYKKDCPMLLVTSRGLSLLPLKDTARLLSKQFLAVHTFTSNIKCVDSLTFLPALSIIIPCLFVSRFHFLEQVQFYKKKILRKVLNFPIGHCNMYVWDLLVLICIFLMTCDVGHLFIILLAIGISSPLSCLLRFLEKFKSSIFLIVRL